MNMRASQKEETRARILQAAIALFEDEAAGEVKLKDIAASAGVSIPTILFHFGSRLQLLVAVGEQLLAKAQAHWPDAAFEGGIIAAIQRYINPRIGPTMRAVWRVGDEVTWLSPRTTEPYADRFHDRLVGHLLHDGYSKADAAVLADLLAPALMMVSRRMQVNNAPEQLARRFVKAVRVLLDSWEADAEPAPRRPARRAVARLAGL